MGDQIDAITLEVLGNSLMSIAEEMGTALIRTAYSANMKERQDLSTAIFTADGQLIVQAEHIPIHLGSMLGIIHNALEKYESSRFYPGDVIITNDPYVGGGTQLSDVTLASPMFHKNKLIAFVANIGHWVDVGGAAPGAGGSGAFNEIYQEGLRIPIMKLAKAGKIQTDVIELIRLNMRNTHERIGDLRAQLAANVLGLTRFKEVLSKFGSKTVLEGMQNLLDYSERRIRKALLAIPQGSYKFKDYMDNDGVSDLPVPVSVNIKVQHGSKPKMTVDFSGSGPQAKKGINLTYTALLAMVYYSVKSLTDPTLLPNAGYHRAIHVVAPEGSIVNAKPPAPVGGRIVTCQRIVDVIIGALSSAVPSKVIAGSTGITTIGISGTNPRSGDTFVMYEAFGGGMGARSNADGTDGIQVHATNTSNLPIEVAEMEYPVIVERYELVNDSAGAGKYRGGLGLRKDIRVLTNVTLIGHSEREKFKPYGLFGGQPGTNASATLNPDRENTKRLKLKQINAIDDGSIISVITSGGGGFGPAHERDTAAVLDDVKAGKIGLVEAAEDYGVVIDSSTMTVDKTTTSKMRNGVRK